MTATVVEQVALVNRYLPEAAKLSEASGGYGWTDDQIGTYTTDLGMSPAQIVRYFWYQRTQETAEYLDLSKPLTQIHKQAKAMLDYWDLVIQTNPTGMEPLQSTAGKRPITFGSIERPSG